MRFGRLRELLSTQLWFVPSLYLCGAAALAVVTLWVDHLGEDPLLAWLPFAGQAESARQLLTTVIASMVTLISLVFSITIVALQLASTQFSPRVLRTFLREPATKSALGVFVGVLAYAIIVLPRVRAGEDDTGFVPVLAVSVACMLVLVAIVVFIHYINAIAHAVRLPNVVWSIAEDTLESAEALYPDQVWSDSPPESEPPSEPPLQTVCLERRGGVLVDIDEHGLMKLAEGTDAFIALHARIGSFIAHGSRVFTVSSGRHLDPAALVGCLSLGRARTMQSDALFGVRQLVDIAARALSPGVNDPTTAIQAIDGIHEVLAHLLRRPFPSAYRADPRGRRRLRLPRPSWDDYVSLAVREISAFAQSAPWVLERMLLMLEDCLSRAPEERRGVLISAREEVDGVLRAQGTREWRHVL